jgi:hypothetical protein
MSRLTRPTLLLAALALAAPALAQSNGAPALRIKEHMTVVGSDGQHVGTVDRVQGQNIVLTKNDPEAGGKHHTIPIPWVASVDQGVTLSKTAQAAKTEWSEAERPGGDPKK